MRWAAKRLVRWVRGGKPRRPAAAPAADPTLAARKAAKLARVRPLLQPGLPCVETADGFDFLTPQLRAEFGVVDTANVSANDYDPTALALIQKYRGGLILDCGAGFRPVYHDDVVNFEIAAYPSTDVRGVGERLPFRDGVFDAAFSFAVLEHVQDPFACAREIARVLKPGGELYCVVPFLQPLHGYPNHYFNMTHQGLRVLFERHLTVERQEVIPSGHPVWALTWMVARWAAGLPPWERTRFLSMRLGDLLDDPVSYLNKGFVTALPEDRRFELASTTALYARKPTPPVPSPLVGEG